MLYAIWIECPISNGLTWVFTKIRIYLPCVCVCHRHCHTFSIFDSSGSFSWKKLNTQINCNIYPQSLISLVYVPFRPKKNIYIHFRARCFVSSGSFSRFFFLYRFLMPFTQVTGRLNISQFFPQIVFRMCVVYAPKETISILSEQWDLELNRSAHAPDDIYFHLFLSIRIVFYIFFPRPGIETKLVTLLFIFGNYRNNCRPLHMSLYGTE